MSQDMDGKQVARCIPHPHLMFNTQFRMNEYLRNCTAEKSRLCPTSDSIVTTQRLLCKLLPSLVKGTVDI